MNIYHSRLGMFKIVVKWIICLVMYVYEITLHYYRRMSPIMYVSPGSPSAKS
jgi:hypothetical protein